jgi:hypothetical protein
MFENEVLKRIFESETEELTGGWMQCYIMRNFIIYTLCRIQFISKTSFFNINLFFFGSSHT